jgi:hypothetical protein
LFVSKVAPVAPGMAALVGAGGAFLPETLSEIVVIPAMAFLFFVLCLPGMVWLPRFMLPRWYRIQKGLERDPRRESLRGVRREERASPFERALGAVPAVGSSEGAGSAASIGGSVGGVADAAADRPSPHRE